MDLQVAGSKLRQCEIGAGWLSEPLSGFLAGPERG